MAEAVNTTKPAPINRRGFLGHLVGAPLAIAAIRFGLPERATFDANAYIDNWSDSDPHVMFDSVGRFVGVTCWHPETTPHGWDDLPAYIDALHERKLVRQV